MVHFHSDWLGSMLRSWFLFWNSYSAHRSWLPACTSAFLQLKICLKVHDSKIICLHRRGYKQSRFLKHLLDYFCKFPDWFNIQVKLLELLDGNSLWGSIKGENADAETDLKPHKLDGSQFIQIIYLPSGYTVTCVTDPVEGTCFRSTVMCEQKPSGTLREKSWVCNTQSLNAFVEQAACSSVSYAIFLFGWCNAPSSVDCLSAKKALEKR